ncbi:MAG: response regulator, partial [Deltaproteobacteria bacterium]|nr:response regulator [Deltaproteobacteria bacterium]
ALEMALSMGDFLEIINGKKDVEQILLATQKRIKKIIPFETCVFYRINEENQSDFIPAVFDPDPFEGYVKKEIEFMIDQGSFAWALRERRGITISSRDNTRQFVLHVIATPSRVRGLFVGLLPAKGIAIADYSNTLLSIILMNTANALENTQLYKIILNQNLALEKKVDKKTKELVMAERKLLHAQKMEAIGTLAGGIAHDLNNILSGLVSYPDLLLMDLPEDSPLRDPVLTIQKSGEKASIMVQDLLTMTRRGVAVKKVIDLNEIISEYVKSPEYNKLKSYHPEVEVKTRLDSNLLKISGSPVHLSKIVMNLVSNAAEALPEGGRINITTQNRYIDLPVGSYDDVEEDDYVVLTVADNGTGISPQDLERIFEPFYTKKVMGRSGTGLGMAIIWGTVKDHKGYIDVESTEGKGTVFTLYFPVTRQEIEKDTNNLFIKDYMGNGESILVVDDVEEQRYVAQGLLRKLGYSVTAVASGEEATEYMKKRSSDLLVLDMIMEPGIDGLETYKRILKLHPGQKAIITSGFSETSRVREAQKLGVGAYVKKPYMLEKLEWQLKKNCRKCKSPHRRVKTSCKTLDIRQYKPSAWLLPHSSMYPHEYLHNQKVGPFLYLVRVVVFCQGTEQPSR